MRARSSALLLCGLVAVLGAYLAYRAVELLRVGTAAGVLLGCGVLLLVLVGGLLLAGEIRFGLASERLAGRLAAEGRLLPPPPDAARLPSGRLTPEAADALFEQRRAEVEQRPQDWRAWWRLAEAYGQARDTARGRRAMRTAITLERGESAAP